MILKLGGTLFRFYRLHNIHNMYFREYLTGFSKRKKLRKAKAKLEKARQEKKRRKEMQAEVCVQPCVIT